MKVYLIGALKNPSIPLLGNKMRELGIDVWDDWYGAGERADISWQEYEQIRGRSYKEALYGDAAENIFLFDKRHLDASDMAVLVLPAGKSGHLEFGYIIGQGKHGYILFPEEPTKYDVMNRFATNIFFNETDLLGELACLNSQSIVSSWGSWVQRALHSLFSFLRR